MRKGAQRKNVKDFVRKNLGNSENKTFFAVKEEFIGKIRGKGSLQ